MSNFNYWWIAAPAMLFGATILGWLTTGMKGCKPQIRKVVDLLCIPYCIVCAVVFGVMLMLESYLGFVQVGLSCLTPSDSEAWADFLALGGIIFSAIAYLFLLGVFGALGDFLKQKFLQHTGEANGLKRRAYCRGISCEEAALACPYSRDEECPCGIDRRVRFELSKTAFEGLMDGIEPLFERQIAAGKTAECALTLPIVDGKVSLSEAELRKLRLQAYQLSRKMPNTAEMRIERTKAELRRDHMRAAHRRICASFRSTFGKRTA